MIVVIIYIYFPVMCKGPPGYYLDFPSSGILNYIQGHVALPPVSHWCPKMMIDFYALVRQRITSVVRVPRRKQNLS